MNTVWSNEKNGLARIAAGSAAAVFLLLFLLSGAMGGRRPLRSSVWLELGLLAVPVLIWVVVRAQRWTVKHDLFSPLVALPVAYGLWFTLGSIDWLEVPSAWLFGFFDPIPARMWFYYALGLLGFTTGVVLVRQNRRTPETVKPWNLGRSRFVLFALLVSMVCSWVVLVAQFGIPGLSSGASEARLNVRGPFYFLFVSSAWTFFLFLPLHGWLATNGKRRPVVTTLLLILTSVLLASLAGRSNIFVPGLTLLIARHYTGKRINLRSAIALALVAFLGLSAFGYLRDTADSDSSLQWMLAVGIPPQMVPAATAAVYVRYSIATFRDVTEMIPAHVPYQLGALTLAPFKTFLPGHQKMSDIFFRDMLGNDFIGVGEPATLLGPLYGDFGVAGVFFGMFGFGLLLAFLYRRMLAAPDPFRILLYAWVLQSGLFGLFATIFPYITTLLLPLFWYGLHRFLQTPANAELNG